VDWNTVWIGVEGCIHMIQLPYGFDLICIKLLCELFVVSVIILSGVTLHVRIMIYMGASAQEAV